MNKLTIPAILVATVMVAGIFAFMPVQQASTVHTTIGTLQVVPCAKSMTGGDTTDTTCTFTTTGNAMIIHQITVSADAFTGRTGDGATEITTVDGLASLLTDTINTVSATVATTGAMTNIVNVESLIGAGVDGSLVTTTSAIVGGTAIGTVTVTLVATSTGTISAA